MQQQDPQEHILEDMEPPKKEPLGIPLTIVSFCFPIVGAILFFVYKDKNREKANTACYAALAGFVLGIIIRLITMAAGDY
jgi:zinc transporter ZupT